MDEKILKGILADNLVYYRKLHRLTQAQLAEKINYSDKSVSKWERGDGVPDIYVLTLLAALYGITVNDLIRERSAVNPVPVVKKRILVPLLSMGLVWLIAAVLFFVLRLFTPQLEKLYLCFVWAAPVSIIVGVVFANLWWNDLLRFLFVSVLIWLLAVALFLTITLESMYLIFMVAGILQVLVLLWYLLVSNRGRKAG